MLWEKETSLVTNSVYFFPQCFLSFGDFLLFSSNSKLLSANSFSLEESRMFSTLSKTEMIILATFNLSSANAFNLDRSRMLLFGQELTTTLKKKAFENIVGKGENAGNQHFPLFQECFLPVPRQISILSHIYFVVCKNFQFGPV